MSQAILIVGSFNQDLTWNCAKFPKPGETIFGVFSTGSRGKGSNQVVAAARTGIPTTFVDGVGCAVFGEETKRFWEKEYIDPRVIEYHSVPTNNTGIFVSGNAENEIIVALGANLAFTLEDFTEDVLPVRRSWSAKMRFASKRPWLYWRGLVGVASRRSSIHRQ